MFNDRPEVRAVIEFFTHGESLKTWMASGGALAPMNDADLSWYGDPMEHKIAALVKDASTVRFDASDLMPAAVGQGTEWKEMTAFVSGQIDQATALQEIDASWPK
jgi:alpha-glucoside transport system substrate-binding protein